MKARPAVLWCYKKALHLSSHRKKRAKQLKKLAQRGLLDPEKEDPFSLFVAATKIRYCYYHETASILGNTYGMCVLQDFEALTPNLLARTVETVEGGGLVVLLLSTLDSLTRLYTLAMDVHQRFRTESHQHVTGRFNERLVLTLAQNPHCLLVDDELNLLPTSSLAKRLRPGPPAPSPDEPGAGPPAKSSLGFSVTPELAELAASLADTQPAGALVDCCRTVDQARALVTFMDAASEKTLRATVALTAARGRGKSAALGLAVAGCLALGYSNVFVASPSPENLTTFFAFLFKALDQLGYQEHLDYSMVESTNLAFGKAIVRVDLYRSHRQTVQYIRPEDHAKLSQAELLVIDEAAAIPLPIVRRMLGPYLVFLCSTVNGYEGTGRSLSLKLIHELRTKARAGPAPPGQAGGWANGKGGAGQTERGGHGVGGRTFAEVELREPIRYAAGDPLEAWLHGLLCLDAAEHVPRPPSRLPHPDECELFYVERDTLFSCHQATEAFLQRMMALYAASHYRNSPNDLQLMSDAPAHHLFVLLGPTDPASPALPDLLVVLQVALEGAISKKAALAALGHGEQRPGDLVPWTISQQFQDAEFPQLSGARVVRIAAHPELTRSGYGSHALNLLRRYYQGELQGLHEEDEDEDDADDADAAPEPEPERAEGGKNGAEAQGLHGERLGPRARLPPLLTALGERPPERLHYLGVAFGLTAPLFKFWERAGFAPVYLRQVGGPFRPEGGGDCTTDAAPAPDPERGHRRAHRPDALPAPAARRPAAGGGAGGGGGGGVGGAVRGRLPRAVPPAPRRGLPRHGPGPGAGGAPAQARVRRRRGGGVRGLRGRGGGGAQGGRGAAGPARPAAARGVRREPGGQPPGPGPRAPARPGLLQRPPPRLPLPRPGERRPPGGGPGTDADDTRRCRCRCQCRC